MEVKVDPKRTALIVFDMINDFLAPGAPFESPNARRLIPRLKPLITACRDDGVQLVYTRLSHRPDGSDLGIMGEIFPAFREGRAFVAGTPGVEVQAELAPQTGDVVIEKKRFGAFQGTELELILRTKGVDTIAMVGTSASIGIESTARAAVDRDFRVVIPSDGTANRDLPDMGWGAHSEEEVLGAVFTVLSQFCHITTVGTLIDSFGGE